MLQDRLQRPPEFLNMNIFMKKQGKYKNNLDIGKIMAKNHVLIFCNAISEISNTLKIK